MMMEYYQTSSSIVHYELTDAECLFCYPLEVDDKAILIALSTRCFFYKICSKSALFLAINWMT